MIVLTVIVSVATAFIILALGMVAGIVLATNREQVEKIIEVIKEKAPARRGAISIGKINETKVFKKRELKEKDYPDYLEVPK